MSINQQNSNVNKLKKAVVCHKHIKSGMISIWNLENILKFCLFSFEFLSSVSAYSNFLSDFSCPYFNFNWNWKFIGFVVIKITLNNLRNSPQYIFYLPLLGIVFVKGTLHLQKIVCLIKQKKYVWLIDKCCRGGSLLIYFCQSHSQSQIPGLLPLHDK